MIFNSVIIPYRDRPDHLKLCLQAFEKCSHRLPTEIVIVDQGSTDDALDIIEPFDERLDINYIYIPDDGPFHLTKVLNVGLKNAQGNYITKIDVDMLPTLTFLANIEQRYDHGYDYTGLKFAHRIHLMDSNQTEMVKNNLSLFYSYLSCNPQVVPNTFPDTYKGIKTGWSAFSIHRETLLKAGGWNEGFKGYGLDDVELNMRLHHSHHVFTDINTKSPLFHLHHGKQANWNDEKLEKQNQTLFEARNQDNFPKYTKPADWGTFENVKVSATASQ